MEPSANWISAIFSVFNIFSNGRCRICWSFPSCCFFCHCCRKQSRFRRKRGRSGRLFLWLLRWSLEGLDCIWSLVSTGFSRIISFICSFMNCISTGIILLQPYGWWRQFCLTGFYRGSNQDDSVRKNFIWVEKRRLPHRFLPICGAAAFYKAESFSIYLPFIRINKLLFAIFTAIHFVFLVSQNKDLV